MHHSQEDVQQQADLPLLDHPRGSMTQVFLLTCTGSVGKVRQDGGTATNEALEEDQRGHLEQAPIKTSSLNFTHLAFAIVSCLKLAFALSWSLQMLHRPNFVERA
mmetsp:Transcript_114/g.875  ORF Transcript_114/g.875 Transcript_114/m.875 type:complete len:105 (-) Transcript_114:2247-2561(-)